MASLSIISKKLLSTLSVVAFLITAAPAQSANEPNSKAAEEAKSLNLQAVKLYREGKYDEAIPPARRSLEIWEKEAGKESQQVANSLLNLAEIYRAKKAYPEAENFYRRVLKVEEKRLGEGNPALCRVLLNLGWMQHVNSQASEAESSFKRMIAIKEKERGPDHPEVANALSNLATFYQKVGKPKNSLPIYERMIAIREKSGDDKRELIEVLEQCQCALNQSGKPVEADRMQQRIVQISENISGEPAQVSGGVLQGKAIYKAQPYYPPAAKAERLSGVVYIKALIDETGNVADAKILCGADLLAAVSLEAARQWRFAPTQINGVPVKVQGVLTFNFTLQ